MKIYIVEGTTGEYSDRSSWFVKAYKSKELAEKALEFLKAKLLENGFVPSKEEYWENYFKTNYYADSSKDKVQSMKAYDPSFEYDYTGICYSIIEVELEE